MIETQSRENRSHRRRTQFAEPGAPGAEAGQAARLGKPNGAGAATRVARGLGWFSVGLGLAQLIAPRGLARLVTGKDGKRQRRTMRAIGLRELAAGVNILRQPQDSRWLWARVAGDVVDLALLGGSLTGRRINTSRVMFSLAAVAGVAALDLATSGTLTKRERLAKREANRVTRAITINRSPEDVYRFWRHLPNLARFMENIESIEVLDDRRSRWRAKAPAGKTIEWVAEITADEPNQRLAWRSVEGSSLPNSGEVRFVRAPGARGSELRLTMEFQPPGGSIGAMFAKVFAKGVEYQVTTDIRQCKQILELGEVVLSDATIGPGPHPARPPEDDEILEALGVKGGV
jgi:uncharacterized membrane protein